MLIKFIFSLLALTVSCKVTMQSNLNSTQITLNEIHSFSQVLVQAQFSFSDSERYQKMHLVVRSANKHKKQAYLDLTKKYNGIVRMLIKLKAIPNKQSMIHSIVHKNFLRKSRKWEFSKYFIIYGFKEQIPQILNRIQIFRPQLVKTAPVIHYLDQKFMSIAAFIQAKLQIERFIKQHLNNQFKIVMTKDIEIIGNKIDNQNIIEAHIQKQFNKNGQQRSQGPSTAQSIQGYYSVNTANKQIKNLTMKKIIDFQDILAEIQQGQFQSHSISDFQQQLLNNQWKKPQQYKYKQQNSLEDQEQVDENEQL